MYLKALEIQGFKSFPEKTVLQFDKDITAIVGPNGSGKSNISDAVRWVMGEQSTKALRGERMEDVIFGGTEKRKQVGFAQVSLIIDNSRKLFSVEGSEVMVTRRYYRSGESEYYINQKLARLRDINELFMDTGLGKDGYSIIGQGRIDEIISTKSSDRREVFEEAAGISRFRYRKEEAERRLERARENLVRINDKIAEIELQVEPLRKQSETAKKYLLLRDELRSLEVSLWVSSIDRLTVQTKKIENDLQLARSEVEEEKKDLQNAYLEQQRLSDIFAAKDIEAEAKRSEISAQENLRSEQENLLAVLSANIKNNEENMDRLKKEISEDEERSKSIAEQIDRRIRRIEEIEKALADIEEEAETLLRSLEKNSIFSEDMGDRLKNLLQRQADEEKRSDELRIRLSAAQALLDELELQQKAAGNEMASGDERLLALAEQTKQKKKELQNAQEDVVSAKNVASGYEMKLAAAQKKSEELLQRANAAGMERDRISSRIDLLEEMEKDYAGYSKSVKTVMQESARRTLRNIYGTVASLLQTDDRYTLAIETALGGSMQSIVVASEEDGKAAINLLKYKDGGRATFLPVSAVHGSELREKQALSEEGVIGLAAHLVSFSPQFDGIFKNLLGRTVIADDINTAIRVSRKYKSAFRIVTLDGQVMNQGGSMTGGSSARNAGLMSRANELRKLKIQIETVSEQCRKAAEEYESAKKEKNRLDFQVEGARGTLREAEDRRMQLMAECSHCESMEETALSAKTALEARIAETKEKQRQTQQQSEMLSCAIADAEKLLAEIDSGIKELTEGREKQRAESERVSEALAELNAGKASLSAEKEATQAAVSELDALRVSMHSGREKDRESIRETEAVNKRLSEDAQLKQKTIDEINEKINGTKAQLAAIIEARMDIERQRVAGEKENQEKNRLVLEREREVLKLEQRLSGAQSEEKQLVDKLWENYELSYSAAQAAAVEIESAAKLQKRISELKRSISALGNPNIGAIEEFERVNARYTFLTDERDDAEKSKSEIEKIIRDISSEMTAIFRREFTQIDRCFRETFLELFGGGMAQLVLEDENDVLNCGIDIKVQPPGKSLKTLSLLSGGEKAFVAIALYYAILKVRPTPFCIMDEIETALDEVNVSRYAQYMRKLAPETQFIVITHRRGMMEEADVLYGVTMQEKGVSKVIKADLGDFEDLDGE